MLKKFLFLEWRSFMRSANLNGNIAFKIVMVLLFVYIAITFSISGIGAFYILKDNGFEPLSTVNRYLIYYLFVDLIMRYFVQKIPTLTIKPLLVLPISKSQIIHFTLGKSILSKFNFSHPFFFIPFSIVLIYNGYNIWGILVWHLGIFCVVFINNFINTLINNRDKAFYVVLSLLAIVVASQYYNVFDLTYYTKSFFQALYDYPIAVLPLVFALVILYYANYRVFKSDLTLDERLHIKKDFATNENLDWLNRFGTIGTFLKNDIKLLRRNKRAKSTLWMSLLFLFYGLIFFTQSIYKDSGITAFAAVFVTGGFMINFGQFVPSWDSSYYQLMMTQSVSYKEYLNSKWWLMVIGTVISMILSSFYIYFGQKIYLLILACCVFNIGLNPLFVLLTGAYNRTAIDLESAKGAFGDKKSFNIKTLLFSLPQLLLPVILFYLGKLIGNIYYGIILIASFGFVGLFFKNFLFNQIIKIYKKEKYKSIAAYKQKK